jgi:hypothetical protein
MGLKYSLDYASSSSIQAQKCHQDIKNRFGLKCIKKLDNYSLHVVRLLDMNSQNTKSPDKLVRAQSLSTSNRYYRFKNDGFLSAIGVLGQRF